MLNSLDINVHSWNLNCEIFHNVTYILLTKVMHLNHSSLPNSLLFGLEFHMATKK